MAEQDIISTLIEFVDVALRNRKYSPNTAYGFRAALKLFSGELSPEELHSFDLFKERFEQIFSSIVNKKQKEFNISSLQVYKRRIQYILRDYEKYGIDPSKMSSWVPARNGTHSPKAKKNVESAASENLNEHSVSSALSDPGYSKHEYSLRSSKKIFISYPSDFTLDEAKSIKSFADYLISMRGGEQTGEK